MFSERGYEFICLGRFYDGCSAQGFSEWLRAYDPDRPEAWIARRDGDFRVAVLDKSRRSVRLFSDRNGQYRVYYAVRGGDVYLSSHLVDLAPLLNPAALSQEQVFFILNAKFSIDPMTMLKDVGVTMPGTFVDMSQAGVSVTRYYRPVRYDAQYYKDMRECVDGLDEAFRRTFRKRLDERRPPTVWLSGGIDSVAMLTYLSEAAPGAVSAFTYAVRDDLLRGGDIKLNDEVSAATIAARHFGVPHEVCRVDPDEIGYRFADCFTDADGVHFANPMYLLLRDRAGALNGRSLYSGQDTRLHTPSVDLPKGIGIRASRTSIPFVKSSLHLMLEATRLWPFRGKRTFAHWRNAAMPREDLNSYFREAVVRYRGETGRSLPNALIAMLPSIRGDESVGEVFKKSVEFMYGSQLTDDMYDFLSGMEGPDTGVHFPFYDSELVEAANRVPFHIGARRMFTLKSWSWVPVAQKAVLRKLLAGRVPDDILYRHKATLPMLHLAFNGTMGKIARRVFDRWGGEFDESLHEDNRAYVRGVRERFLCMERFTIPEDFMLLWDVYSIVYMTVLGRICSSGMSAVDDLRGLIDDVRREAAKGTGKIVSS